MVNKFSCPHCKADLNPGTKIILRVSSQGRHGLILFSPKVGNYTSVMPTGFALASGELADFSCPACHADILSPANERFGELLLSRDDGDLMRVNFSRVFGEQATFLIFGEEVESFGPDADAYGGVNFFGAGPQGLD